MPPRELWCSVGYLPVAPLSAPESPIPCLHHAQMRVAYCLWGSPPSEALCCYGDSSCGLCWMRVVG